MYAIRSRKWEESAVTVLTNCMAIRPDEMKIKSREFTLVSGHTIDNMKVAETVINLSPENRRTLYPKGPQQIHSAGGNPICKVFKYFQ